MISDMVASKTKEFSEQQMVCGKRTEIRDSLRYSSVVPRVSQPKATAWSNNIPHQSSEKALAPDQESALKSGGVNAHYW